MSLDAVPLDQYLCQPSTVERHLRRLLWGHRSPVIFDIGACEGEETIRYARLFPKSRIYTFEPLPENQELVRQNFRTYDATNAELAPIALSNRFTPATFHVSSGRPSDEFMGEACNYGRKSSSLSPPAEGQIHNEWLSFEREITVQCETVDEFCANRGFDQIDFIHMDVQEAEDLVLERATRMLPRTTSIWLEVAEAPVYRGQKIRSEMEAFMKLHNFTLILTEHRGLEGDQFYVNRGTTRGLLYQLLARAGNH